MHRILALSVVSLLLSSTAPAQRATAELAWKKHEIEIEYGAVPVGKHSLSSLPVGRDWRMGMNIASQIRLDVPLLAADAIAADAIAAPGSYRVKILRTSEQELQLLVEGAGHALGARSSGARLPGQVSDTKKPGKRLELEFARAKGKALADSQLKVEFGATTLTIPVRVLDAQKHRGKRFAARVFAWPTETLTERMQKKLPTPVATVTRKRVKKGEIERYNVVIDAESAQLIPWMQAPSDSYGFGEIEIPTKESIIIGSVQWADAESKHPPEFVRTEGFTATKSEIRLDLTIGKRRGTFVFEP